MNIDCHKTLLDLFHSKTPHFFTELKHSATKNFISRGNKRESQSRFRKRKLCLGFFTIVLDDKVIRPFSFLLSRSYYSWSAKHYNRETCLATAKIILEKGQHEF